MRFLFLSFVTINGFFNVFHLKLKIYQVRLLIKPFKTQSQMIIIIQLFQNQ